MMSTLSGPRRKTPQPPHAPRPPRRPRPEELDLLATLLDGPLPISSGPLGRCLKRGWCRTVHHAAGSSQTPRFALTETGRALLAEGGGLRPESHAAPVAPDPALKRPSDA
jgi:hypothetical protein